jgi:hypothetical protein
MRDSHTTRGRPLIPGVATTVSRWCTGGDRANRGCETARLPVTLAAQP